jgi:hypothetical protein
MAELAEPTQAPEEPGYRGPAEVLIGDQVVPVTVELRGFFQPIDGRFHWYGRIAANPELNRLVTGQRAEVVLRTPHDQRAGEVSDPDLWGRYRISSTGYPPFPLELDLPVAEAG